MDLDRLNDILFQRHRSDSIADVKAMANAAHADIVGVISHLADADLQRAVGEYSMSSNPDRLLLEKIAGDTYEHYAEHAGWIKDLLAH
jgi:hypothetical protein